MLKNNLSFIHSTLKRRLFILAFAALPGMIPLAGGSSAPPHGISLSHLITRADVRHHQQWGVLGIDRAANLAGRQGSVLQIGRQTYEQGVGHHAQGEITVPLNGRYRAFRAKVGIQWQGGGKGSVIFRVLVDGKTAFDSGRMTDSDSPKNISVVLTGAEQMTLVSDHAGDTIACDMANWVNACLEPDPDVAYLGNTEILLNKRPAPEPTADVCGLFFIGKSSGPQAAIMAPSQQWTAAVADGETITFKIPLHNVRQSLSVSAQVRHVHGGSAEAAIWLQGKKPVYRRIAASSGMPLSLSIKRQPEKSGHDANNGSRNVVICFSTRGTGPESGVSWQNIAVTSGRQSFIRPLRIKPASLDQFPPPPSPALRPAMMQALIEWDWRLQDGIGHPHLPASWQEATVRIARTTRLLWDDLARQGMDLSDLKAPWQAILADTERQGDDAHWERCWRRLHQLRRRLAFRNPLAQTGPILFVKRVPSAFSHQLTQYASRHARAGGGLFVLDRPGLSMQCRPLTQALPAGSFQFADVSPDGRRILFSFCPTHSDRAVSDAAPNNRQAYHLHEMNADGTGLRQLTGGPFDDFAARYLPGGGIIFLSTRRGGFHRCGKGPCHVHTLAAMDADGTNIRVISFHETHEWDPAVLQDGRIIYTRWDYVDRHAVHYQQLWTTRPDGTDARIFYGNNTLNPVGVWEARPVPGTADLVMATAAAHHAMTTGSIILLDIKKGVDGSAPITRLTPDVPFPESELPVAHWHAPVGVTDRRPIPAAARRRPGHSYRSPYPLSETYFLAAYSFQDLIGEPHANPPNMFGLYWVDRFGNKELLYRDPNIGSLWPMPLRPRREAPRLASILEPSEKKEGTFFLHNVYDSWPGLPAGKSDAIKSLRIIQVLPKSTPHANDPRVGLANASPGKQVLGTVPVERDGSAFFRAPSGTPVTFQALDERGRAVQIMRSLVYLQPGENASCVGCHEHRSSAPGQMSAPLALKRPPSAITPGPEGSKPFNFQRLVQPVLDKHCIRCHKGPKAPKGINLTGKPAGAFTLSYNALAPRVPFSQWEGGHFQKTNSEPLSRPDFFGARASPLAAMLMKGHSKVVLSERDWERLITWMDNNALFYGTFDREDQKRQLRGELIAGPALE